MKNSNKFLIRIFLLTLIASCSDDEPDIPFSTPCEEIGGRYNTTLTLTNRSEDPSVADYCVTESMVITDGAGLIIEPGVVIEFAAGTNLQLGLYSLGANAGYIIANGTEENPIVFRGTENIPGIWGGIMIGYQAYDVRNVLNHCIIEFAGASNNGYGLFVNRGTNGEEGLISLTNSTIRYTQGTGFLTAGDNNIYDFRNNFFLSNDGPAIEINPQDFSHIDEATRFTDNDPNGVFGQSGAFADEISDGQSHTWNKLSNGFYYVNEKIELFDNSQLILNPGVHIVMNSNNAKLEVKFNSGTSIQANGTAEEPIIIRGPQAGVVSWEGINLVDNSNNIFTYCNISEAGLSNIGHSGCNSYELTTFNLGGCGRATIENCNIANSGGCGIFVEATSMDLIESDNTFTNMTVGDICN